MTRKDQCYVLLLEFRYTSKKGRDNIDVTSTYLSTIESLGSRRLARMACGWWQQDSFDNYGGSEQNDTGAAHDTSNFDLNNKQIMCPVAYL